MTFNITQKLRLTLCSSKNYCTIFSANYAHESIRIQGYSRRLAQEKSEFHINWIRNSSKEKICRKSYKVGQKRKGRKKHRKNEKGTIPTRTSWEVYMFALVKAQHSQLWYLARVKFRNIFTLAIFHNILLQRNKFINLDAYITGNWIANWGKSNF